MSRFIRKRAPWSSLPLAALTALLFAAACGGDDGSVASNSGQAGAAGSDTGGTSASGGSGAAFPGGSSGSAGVAGGAGAGSGGISGNAGAAGSAGSAGAAGTGGSGGQIETADYYVSPSGSDSDPGTIDKPFKTFAKANSVVVAGQLVYLRGGIYKETVKLTKSGSASAPIRWHGYPGEAAIIEGPGRTTSLDTGLTISGDWLNVRDLTVRNSARTGIFIFGNDARLERIVSHGNGRVGINFYHVKNGSLTDCLAYDNYDKYDSDGTLSHGQDADGIATSGSTGVVVKRCVSFNNADDGFDFWEASNSSVEDSFTFGNGINRWGDSAFEGNGNGFKMGGPGSTNNLVQRCVAFDNPMRGFVDNAAVNSKFFNNTSIGNKVGFQSSASTNTFINNVSFDDTNERQSGWSGVSESNTWDLKLSVQASHFASVKRPAPTGSEGLDAILSMFLESDFARPAVGSPLVDAGKKLSGVTYSGTAPDLGGKERP
ncbi:MAG: right-handed parallel beta-helix repeat-containing protein [Polyangiaceae bacterium]